MHCLEPLPIPREFWLWLLLGPSIVYCTLENHPDAQVNTQSWLHKWWLKPPKKCVDPFHYWVCSWVPQKCRQLWKDSDYLNLSCFKSCHFSCVWSHQTPSGLRFQTGKRGQDDACLQSMWNCASLFINFLLHGLLMFSTECQTFNLKLNINLL